ncbi:MAG: hypothetical protein KIT39_12065 [Nitrospirales bacterium]|nr:hypothetical protein [Nitrospirales bacterium]
MTTDDKWPIPIRGGNAYQAILSKLRENPLAQKMAKGVYEFYGDFLTYAESQEALSSKFRFDIQHEPIISFKTASILLRLGTGREAEALVHELLHLQLPIQGFSLIEGAEISDEIPEESSKAFVDMYGPIQNLVHHEINIGNFKALGYLKRDFLGSASPPPFDYKRKVLNTLPHSYDWHIGFSWWCLEYFRHWISLRHGRSLEVNNHAKDALQWGSEVHPTLKQAAEGMMEWVKFGEFKNSSQYVDQVNNLLEIMKIPKVTKWVLLECPNPQRPIAKRLIL